MCNFCVSVNYRGYKPGYQDTSTSINQDGSVDSIMDSTSECQQVLNAEGDDLMLFLLHKKQHTMCKRETA